MPQATRTLPSAEYLHQCFAYDGKTGRLFWKRRPHEHFASTRSFKITTKRYAEQVAGSLHSNGYIVVHLDGKEVFAARIIYKMHYLSDPVFVDHIDRDKQNDRLANLRNATNAENSRNSIQKPGETGYPGVKRQGRKFQSRIKINDIYIHLGTFITAEEAYAAYQIAANRLFKSFSAFHVDQLNTEDPPVTQA